MRLEKFRSSAEDWNQILGQLPAPHLLQTWQWGQVKAQTGWEMHPLVWRDERDAARAAALLLVRRIPIRGLAARLSIAYVPRGPLLDWNDQRLQDRVLTDLRRAARGQGAMYLKIDPDVPLRSIDPAEPAGEGRPDPLGSSWTRQLSARGWHVSPDQIQYRSTVLIDLEAPEDQLLARMKQKTRYNIRLAGRKGVSIRPAAATDFEELYRMYAETSVRDGFVIRPFEYYRALWQTFLDAGMLYPLIAEVDSVAVAAVVIFRFASRAWYIQGMSRAVHREKMPSYLLQWEAMRRARAAGCGEYDLWGAPDNLDESDPMWGVYRFKSGFGGRTVRHVGAWDVPIRPFFYRLYTYVLPRVLDWMRRRGQARTRSEHADL